MRFQHFEIVIPLVKDILYIFKISGELKCHNFEYI